MTFMADPATIASLEATVSISSSATAEMTAFPVERITTTCMAVQGRIASPEEPATTCSMVDPGVTGLLVEQVRTPSSSRKARPAS
jgi:hypothetical protein